MLTYIIANIISTILTGLGVGFYLHMKHKQEIPKINTSPNLDILNLENRIQSLLNRHNNELSEHLNKIPGNVLNSITSSASIHKGRLAELIAYLDLRASYDRLIPLGGIVDFIGIKFPEGSNPGRLCFIDVKNGESSKLSKQQAQLNRLIKENRIEFIKLRIDTDVITREDINVISNNTPEESI